MPSAIHRSISSRGIASGLGSCGPGIAGPGLRMPQSQPAGGFDEFARSLFAEQARNHQEYGRAFRDIGRRSAWIDAGARNGNNARGIADHAAGADVVGVGLVVDEDATVAAQRVQ